MEQAIAQALIAMDPVPLSVVHGIVSDDWLAADQPHFDVCFPQLTFSVLDLADCRNEGREGHSSPRALGRVRARAAPPHERGGITRRAVFEVARRRTIGSRKRRAPLEPSPRHGSAIRARSFRFTSHRAGWRVNRLNALCTANDPCARAHSPES